MGIRRHASPARIVGRIAGPSLAALGVLAAAAGLLVACGGNAAPQATATVTVTASPSASPNASPSPKTMPSGTATSSVSVYFLRPIGGSQPDHGPFVATAHRAVPVTRAVATAAMNALLAGPTARDRAIGMTSDLPAGTTLRGVTIAGGVATVDLSSAFAVAGTTPDMTARLAQVVYTLTQFPSVGRGVLFKVDGKALTSFGATAANLTRPQRRADYESVTPPIFVESPAPFDNVAGKAVVIGTANVFEATFRAKLVDAAGREMTTMTVTATSGSGTRGQFMFNIPIMTTATAGKLLVWDPSAENGSALHTVTIPLTFRH